MLRKLALLSWVCLGLACAGMSAADPAADRAAIAAATADTEAAENAGSVERMRAHLAEDVVMMAPDMPAVVGAAAVAEAMGGFFDSFAMEIDYESEEIGVVGDLGFDRGTFSQTLTPKAGGPAIAGTGKYLWIYRRSPDGTWKQSRVIWNSSDPAQPAP